MRDELWSILNSDLDRDAVFGHGSIESRNNYFGLDWGIPMGCQVLPILVDDVDQL